MASLFDCANNVYVNVQSYSTFASVNTTSPVTNGVFNTSSMQYNAGGPGDIVIVQVFYQWQIYVSLLDSGLGALKNGNRLLVATSVFRNEPYK
jgi:hypothetical protein